MLVIEIEIEYAGGIIVVDKATWNEETGDLHVSERLKQIVRTLDSTEARPSITATCYGQAIDIEPASDGDFRIAPGQVVTRPPKGVIALFRQTVRQPSKEQRQQVGRYLHTLSAASAIGAIGFWHSTNNWNWQNALSEANLWIAAVIIFCMGIICMNGD
jgi:hypothetical protein